MRDLKISWPHYRQRDKNYKEMGLPKMVFIGCRKGATFRECHITASKTVYHNLIPPEECKSLHRHVYQKAPESREVGDLVVQTARRLPLRENRGLCEVEGDVKCMHLLFRTSKIIGQALRVKDMSRRMACAKCWWSLKYTESLASHEKVRDVRFHAVMSCAEEVFEGFRRRGVDDGGHDVGNGGES